MAHPTTPPRRRTHHTIASLGVGTLLVTSVTPTAQATVDPRATSANTLASLAQPIAACVDNRAGSVDRSSPMFSSCIDWHSSVHAHYALLAVTRHGGPSAAKNRALQTITDHGSAAELDYMRTRVAANQYDNPYGFAWFLRLAREYEQTTGSQTLRPLANEAAHHVKQAATRADVTVTNSGYGNLSWAMLNLAEWSRFTGNTTDLELAQQAINHRVKAQQCSVTQELGGAGTGFFPPCLMRLAAVASVEGAAASDWLKAELPSTITLTPRQTTGGHGNALNFSRAYAVAAIAGATSDPQLAAEASALLLWQVDRPTVWTTDFARNSHWLAQFGVLAATELHAIHNPTAPVRQPADTVDDGDVAIQPAPMPPGDQPADTPPADDPPAIAPEKPQPPAGQPDPAPARDQVGQTQAASWWNNVVSWFRGLFSNNSLLVR